MRMILQNYQKRVKLVFTSLMLLLSLQASAVEVTIIGPSVACPFIPYTFSVSVTQSPSGIPVTCSGSWLVYKDGVIISPQPTTGTITFPGVGKYTVVHRAFDCGIFLPGEDSQDVYVYVKPPNPITGIKSVCPGQTKSYTSPLLSNTPADCNNHFEYTWTAPTGWSINGGGNTLFAHGSTIDLTVPSSTAPGDYYLKVKSYIFSPNGTKIYSADTQHKISVGPYSFQPSDLSISGPATAAAYTTVNLEETNRPTGVIEYYWRIGSSPGAYIQSGQGTNSVVVAMPSRRGFEAVTVLLQVRGNCSSSPTFDMVAKTFHIIERSSYYSTSSMFPNPADDYIEITSSEEDDTRDLSKSEKLEITILDKFGRIVKKEKSARSSFKVDLKEIPSNTYFIHINDGVKTIRKQLTVKH